MYKEVNKWLAQAGMPVSSGYLRLRLQSHPDYPSLIAVQDTLGELGITSNAFQTDKENLLKASQPFLAHFNKGEGQILYFKTLAEAENKVKDFDRHWSGVAMLAERTDKYGNAAYDKLHNQEKQNSFFSIAAVVLLLVAAIGITIWKNAVESLLLLITNAAGLYFSWLIVQKEFGISNSVSDKICSMAKHSRCESVLFSKGAKLFNWLSWGDLGIVYFTSSLLYLLITQLTNHPVNLYYAISLTGFIFPIYSLYYQWKIVKQWCMLCIAVLAVLVTNGIISLFNLKTPLWTNDLLYLSALYTFILAFALATWQLLKSLYQKSLASLSNEIKALQLKRNPDIFNGLLLKEEQSPAHLPAPDEAIQFGNPDAPYQIVMACNPYCGPCARAHQAIEELYEKYPGQLSVTVRFALVKNDDTNNNVLAAREIIKAAKQKPYDAVKDWYKLFDMEKYKQLHHTNGEIVDTAVEKHIDWNKKANIQGTPTFFINGKKLPELYSWVDFTEILSNEIRN